MISRLLAKLVEILKGTMTSSTEADHGDDRDMRSRFAEQTIGFWKKSTQKGEND